MCGIFGTALLPGSGLDAGGFATLAERLFRLSETRGKEAAGIACQTPDKVWVHKDARPATEMIKTPAYARIMRSVAETAFSGNGLKAEYVAAIGHSRLVTNGMQGIDANNQPVYRDDIVTVHNGIVVNVDELWQANPDLKRTAQVDTEVINALLRKQLAGGAGLAEAIARVYSQVNGETSIAVLFRDHDVMALATNTGSIYVGDLGPAGQVVFVSEGYILDGLARETGQPLGPRGVDGKTVATRMHDRQLMANSMLLIDLRTHERTLLTFEQALSGDQPTPAYARGLGTMRAIEEKSLLDAQFRARIRRCTRCLLPETMPYIAYDPNGVCNYCANHQRISMLGENALEEKLAPFRSTDGSPDCLVAFSGGRDSSYGLHLLKTKYRMNPVAYTYDWGLVTDLARRNQARLCGKLGVEHLWVSADIKAKRANVRANVLAWMKRPELGMIPLFMAGDKQFFRFANQAMKQNELKLIVFFDNQYEKTDFKAGFAGVKPGWFADSEKRHYKLGAGQKFQMISYYGGQFLRNPAYINRSVPDTLSAYASYYLEKNDFLPFFGYEEWEEETVNRTLLGEYDWEKARDTDTTWRIGDGTAPFYNHVYRTVAGFNEYDTFRSNQIREGVITRERALEMIERDNEPRWDSIRDYTQMINVDFDDLLRVVNNIPRLYWPEEMGGRARAR